MRRIHRSDSNQAEIVEGLRKCGVIVEIIEQPVDLACRRKCWPDNIWRMVEIKAADKNGKAVTYNNAKQKKQHDFCKEHGIPMCTSVTEVLSYLHSIEL